MNNRLINTKVAGGGGGCTDIVDNYDPFGGNGVALYQLNGNADDLSPNSYDGTPYLITYSTGVFGQAATYSGGNGLTSSIYIPNTVYTTSTSIFSASIWIKLNNGLGEPIFIGNGGTVGGTTGWALYGDNNTGVVGITFRDTNQNQIFDSSGISINDGAWHNLVVTNNNGEYRVYLDTQEVISGTTTLFTNNQTPTYQTFLGNRFGRNENNSGINGQIDQVRIFNTALTPLEVEALYTEELCICDGTVDTLQVLGDTSCIATYQLDGNANDLSGNYSGTPTNVSYGVGEFDLAGVFNGSSSYVENSNIPNEICKGYYTVNVWAYIPTSQPYSSVVHMQDDNNGHLPMLNIAVNQNYWTVNLRSNSSSFLDSTDIPITFNSWNMITVVLHSGGGKFYLNGSEVASSSFSPVFTTNTSCKFSLGRTYQGWIGGIYNYLNGSIDQVRIFNKALNSTEVTTLYNETACTKVCTSGTTNTLDILGDGSCIATYPLDGSPADLSGNYNGVQTDLTYPVGEFDLAAAINRVGYIQVPDLTIPNTTSISLWAKPNSNTVGGTLFSAQTSDYRREYPMLIFYPSSPFNGFAVIYTQNAQFITSSTVASVNVWHHIVCIKNSDGSGSMYVDNVLIGTIGANTTHPQIAGFTLGAKYEPEDNFLGDFFPGEIDQVRIFNKALSAGEVTTLYNETPCN